MLDRITKAATSNAEQARLDALVARLQPLIRAAFVEAVNRIGSQIDIRALADLLQAGRVSEAIAMVDAALSNAGFRSFANTTSSTVLDAAGATITAMRATYPALGAADFSFGPMNPATVAFTQNYQVGLIREMTADVRATVQNVLVRGISSGTNPLDVAREIKASIGLTATQAQAVANFRTMLETGDSAALQRALRDKRFDPSITRAINGETLDPEKIDTMVGRYYDRFIQYRAQTIARTEAIRATNTGNHLAWAQAISDGVVPQESVSRHWIYTHDGKTRPAHVMIPTMNPDGVGFDEPFQSPLGPIMYPGDPDAPPSLTINCRCTVFLRYRPLPDQQETS